AKGGVLHMTATDERRAQIEELMALTGAELTFDMLAESMRGMALGMHLSASGDIEVPWDEIDAGVTAQLAGMRNSLLDSTRAVFAYPYAPLTAAEVEAYVAFLRTPAAQNFYRTITASIGTIMQTSMFRLGESVAQRLQRVNI